MQPQPQPEPEPEIERPDTRPLSEATKTNTYECRAWKAWFRLQERSRAKEWTLMGKNPATVRDPSFRQTLLCMAIAHSRGKVHADVFTSFGYSPYGTIQIRSLEDQAKILTKFVKGVESYAGITSVKDGRRRAPELSSEEIEAVRGIIDATSQKTVDASLSA
jgi:hypothetical protein